MKDFTISELKKATLGHGLTYSTGVYNNFDPQ